MVAAARNPKGSSALQDLTSKHGSALTLVKLDVSDSSSIEVLPTLDIWKGAYFCAIIKVQRLQLTDILSARLLPRRSAVHSLEELTFSSTMLASWAALFAPQSSKWLFTCFSFAALS